MGPNWGKVSLFFFGAAGWAKKPGGARLWHLGMLFAPEPLRVLPPVTIVI